MGQDSSQGPPQNVVGLKPITALVEAPPEPVCVALLRYAANPASVPASIAGERSMHAKWAAQRREGQTSVTYLLQEGPLGYMHLQFAAESDGADSSVLWVTGEYAQKKSLLNGALERWRAQRDATALRDGVLAVLKATVRKDDVSAQPARVVRGSERLSVRAPARLTVGTRSWRAEVLDVSETGIAVVAATLPNQADADAHLLLQEEIGEIEVLLPGEKSRARVLVKRATPSRGGVQVGLQVIDAEGLLPLLKKALGRMKATEHP
jgi:hypothetical protein